MDQVFTLEDEDQRMVDKRMSPGLMITEVGKQKPIDYRTPEDKQRELDESFGIDPHGIHQNAQRNIFNTLHHLTKYDPDYGPLLIYHMGKGYTYQSFATIIGVSGQTVNNWLKAYPDFKFCKEIAENRMKLKWERIILESAQGLVKGNAAAIIFAIKNYFPDQYKDKREVEHTAAMMVVDTGIRRVDGKIVEAEVRQLDRRRRPIIQDKVVEIESQEIPSAEYCTEDLEDQL